MTGRPDCEHGGVAAARARGGWTWNGPIGRCACCEMTYPYSDSLTATSDGTWSKTWTPSQCASCGGHFVQRHVSAPSPSGDGSAL